MQKQRQEFNLRIMKKIIRYSAFSTLLFLVSCAATISTFDQYAYTKTTSLKVDALNLMDKAVDNYSSHEKEIQDINTELQKAYEYEKNRPNNETTTSMWELLMNDASLYGGFISLWKEQGTVSKVAIQAAKTKIAENFDRIAQLESKKIQQ